MSDLDIVRAWKDEEYRFSLSEEQLAMLPDNPAGLVELANPWRTDGPQGADDVLGSLVKVCPTMENSCITACFTPVFICSIHVCPTQIPCPIPIPV